MFWNVHDNLRVQDNEVERRFRTFHKVECCALCEGLAPVICEG